MNIKNALAVMGLAISSLAPMAASAHEFRTPGFDSRPVHWERSGFEGRTVYAPRPGYGYGGYGRFGRGYRVGYRPYRFHGNRMGYARGYGEDYGDGYREPDCERHGDRGW